jgi:hypothetical protein
MKRNILKRNNFQPIKKIGISIDHIKLLSCFENFISKQDLINKEYGSEFINSSYEQMTITKPANDHFDDEHSYNELLDEFKNSYVEEVLSMFRAKPTRVRYIVKKPGAFILPHIDYDTTYSMRYYIPLKTNEWAFTAIKEKNKEPMVVNLKADGSVYFVNPGYMHSAWNFGSSDDIRLILSVNGQEDYYE